MDLHAALGLSLMFTEATASRSATRCSEVSSLRSDWATCIVSFVCLNDFTSSMSELGNFREALAFAQRGEGVATEIGDPVLLGQIQVALGNFPPSGRQ